MPTPHGFESWEERERRRLEEERARKERLSPAEEAKRNKEAGEARRVQTARRASAAVREVLLEWIEAHFSPQDRARVEIAESFSNEERILDSETDHPPNATFYGSYNRKPTHLEIVPRWGVYRVHSPDPLDNTLLFTVLADQGTLEVKSSLQGKARQEEIARALHMATGLTVTVNPEPDMYELRWRRAAAGDRPG